MGLVDIEKNWNGIPFQKNHFLSYYDKIFPPLRDKEGINILELGVKQGGSLQLWDEYFHNIQFLVGVDINLVPVDPVFRDRCYSGDLQYIHLLERDLSDKKSYDDISKFGSFDIIIDDASHKSEDFILSFDSLFHLLSSGGYYCIENFTIQDQDSIDFLTELLYNTNSLRNLQDKINYRSWWVESVYLEEQLLVVKKRLYSRPLINSKLFDDDSAMTQEAHNYHISK